MQPTVTLDVVFRALADPTRRAVLQRLSDGAVAVKELAEPFDMALPSFLQHLRVLEESGLVRSHKSGRVRTYQISPEPLQMAEGWLCSQRRQWDTRLGQLDGYLSSLAAKNRPSRRKDKP
jgi:DNA-binding transcriptional ArsR family regulator